MRHMAENQNSINDHNAPAGVGGWLILRKMLPYLWPQGQTGMRVRVVLSIICLVLAKIVILLAPFAYGKAVNLLEAEAGREAALLSVPILLIIAYLLMRVVSSGLQQLRDGVFAQVGMRALRQLAVKTFTHLHDLPLRFHLERRTGSLSRVVDRGTKAIDFLLKMLLFNLVPTLLEIILATAVVWWVFDWRYGVGLGGAILIYSMTTYYLTEWRTNFRKLMNDRDNEANQKAIDSLLNYETVKYFSNEKLEISRFDKAMAGYEHAWIWIYISLGILNFAQAVIFGFGSIYLMVILAQDVMAGSSTLGDFVFMNTLLMQVYYPLNFLGTVFREIRQAVIDMESMFGLLEQKSDIVDSPSAPALHLQHGGEIVFDNVCFAYQSDRQILRNVSFRVPAGQSLAIVGHSGAGKSTISRLLLRFYQPSQGRILIDGQDIGQVTQDSVRQVIGVVPQDTVLFNDTIGYNISYGQIDAPSDAIEQAVKDAQLTSFIQSLPNGYDTLVGERGLKLSGGEKQRIAISRTLLKNPPILLLDEATSALDSHTEKEIQQALNQMTKRRTSLIIAHRLSTIMNADQILVLEQGQVVEIGNHESLLQAGGLYASLWYQQKKQEQVL